MDVSGAFIVQSTSGSLKAALSAVMSVEACQSHFDMTREVFGDDDTHTLDSGIALAEALIQVRVSRNGYIVTSALDTSARLPCVRNAGPSGVVAEL